MKAKVALPKAFLAFTFTMAIIVLSKVKLWPIFGTWGKFSLVGPFLPVIPYFIGAGLAGAVIFAARLLQFAIGISTPRTMLSNISFLPGYLAGIQLAKHLKKDRRGALIIPAAAIALFIAHPIGRQVWFFSLFWLIPIVIALLQSKIVLLFKKRDVPTLYLYSLSATFVDHAVGSIMYLYYFNIQAVYWVMAIPYVIVERAIFALFIMAFFLFVRESLKAFERVISIYVPEVHIVPVEIEEEKAVEEVVLAKN